MPNKVASVGAERPHGRPPSVDRIVSRPDLRDCVDSYGHSAVVEAVRFILAEIRESGGDGQFAIPAESEIAARAIARLETRQRPILKPVYNLTGTVLHTNLGRAILPEAAVRQASLALANPCNLEFDLDGGGRGERDTAVADLLVELTGAEAATVVNNNAAAVLLVLAAIANRREVVVSRGELVEIGGSFRIPDVMRSANARLVEVGTTNRTHLADYDDAVGERTAALMKVHRSNFLVSGFVAEVSHGELASLAHRRSLPLIVDLGAGSLIDLAELGLPGEPVVADVLKSGADLVTFSGDKLVGGPQAGLIVGRKDLIDRLNRHPLKRALRVSKVVLAALEAVLLEYRRPDRLREALPTMRLLTRAAEEIEALAERLRPLLAAVLGPDWNVSVGKVASQVGSGSLPVDVLPSFALTIRPVTKKGAGTALKQLSATLRALPRPVIGRIAEGAVLLDVRCLEDEADFAAEIERLR